jgi:hypothetical protein
MARPDLTFGDIVGKLHMLRVECTRCARRGQYSVASGMRLNCTNAATCDLPKAL